MRWLSVRASLTCLAGAMIAALAGLSTCGQASEPMLIVEGGDPERGKAAIRYYGCGSCHMVPAIPGANGNVGPPLIDMARQVYLAWVLICSWSQAAPYKMPSRCYKIHEVIVGPCSIT